MFKKTDHRETESESVPLKIENNPAFVKSNGNESEELPVALAVKNRDISRVNPKKTFVIGSTVVFRGRLSADEEILIQGKVEGTIAHHKENVIVGKEGRVNALIHAKSITIEGRVDGDIHCDVFVRLAESAEVNGNIFCPCVRMDDGARFNGTMRME